MGGKGNVLYHSRLPLLHEHDRDAVFFKACFNYSFIQYAKPKFILTTPIFLGDSVYRIEGPVFGEVIGRCSINRWEMCRMIRSLKKVAFFGDVYCRRETLLDLKKKKL